MFLYSFVYAKKYIHIVIILTKRVDKSSSPPHSYPHTASSTQILNQEILQERNPPSFNFWNWTLLNQNGFTHFLPVPSWIKTGFKGDISQITSCCTSNIWSGHTSKSSSSASLFFKPWKKVHWTSCVGSLQPNGCHKIALNCPVNSLHKLHTGGPTVVELPGHVTEHVPVDAVVHGTAVGLHSLQNLIRLSKWELVC